MTAEAPDMRLSPRAERVTVNHEYATVDELLREYVTNLSSTGVFIRSDEPLPVGTKVRLNFSVLSSDLEIVSGIGKVVRVSTQPSGMGVAFIELDERSEAVIARLLKRPESR